MAILSILEFPDPRLRTVAVPVTLVDARVQQLTDDMLETMYDAPGIGLAATQVDALLPDLGEVSCWEDLQIAQQLADFDGLGVPHFVQFGILQDVVPNSHVLDPWVLLNESDVTVHSHWRALLLLEILGNQVVLEGLEL